jgi:hypothetical protein
MKSPVADWQSPCTLLLHHVTVLALTHYSFYFHLLWDQLLLHIPPASALSTLFITYSTRFQDLKLPALASECSPGPLPMLLRHTRDYGTPRT